MVEQSLALLGGQLVLPLVGGKLEHELVVRVPECVGQRGDLLGVPKDDLPPDLEALSRNTTMISSETNARSGWLCPMSSRICCWISLFAFQKSVGMSLSPFNDSLMEETGTSRLP